jgi:hypothetical protein
MEKRRSTEQRNTVTISAAATQGSTFEWREEGAQVTENDKLRLLIDRLTRHQFGRRSEQLAVEQLQQPNAASVSIGFRDPG